MRELAGRGCCGEIYNASNMWISISQLGALIIKTPRSAVDIPFASRMCTTSDSELSSMRDYHPIPCSKFYKFTYFLAASVSLFGRTSKCPLAPYFSLLPSPVPHFRMRTPMRWIDGGEEGNEGEECRFYRTCSTSSLSDIVWIDQLNASSFNGSTCIHILLFYSLLF